MIVPGSHSQALAARLAAETGRPLARPTYDEFPDGELLAEVPGFDAREAVVVAATVSTDAHVELLQLQDAVREAGAEQVTTVLPYMGYSRQDEAFKPGQPVSARAMARALATGADRVVLVTPHEPSIAAHFDVPCATVEAAPVLAEPLPDDLAEPVFVAPDAGAIDLAETVRDAYGGGTADFFEKERDYDTGDVTIAPGSTDVAGRDVVLVDDIVATGTTVSESIEALRARDVGRVCVSCVHALLVGNARTKLEAAGVDGIWGTDTVEREVSAGTVAPLVAREL